MPGVYLLRRDAGWTGSRGDSTSKSQCQAAARGGPRSPLSLKVPARKRAEAFSEGHFSTRTASPHTSKISVVIPLRQMGFAYAELLLAAYTPPLRNKVRQPAGFPTPFRGRAYPVLVGVVYLSGRKPSADWGRGLRAPSPCPYPQGDWGRGACPPPCPYPATTPQSAAADSSLHRGAKGNLRRCGSSLFSHRPSS